MTIDNQIPSHTVPVDGQSVTVIGPDGAKFGFQYDQQLRAFFHKPITINPNALHGATHISSDPIPNATCTTPGLMAADDKCKLDSVLGTRLGVLGFQGAGFPDDGGWLSGDVILSAGSEFISLERVGNVIRFVVDVPAPFNCGCEECFQIFWVQDETDTSAIRPPTCSGRLPGVNAYGELKVYAFPENTIVNANNVSDTLNDKGQYPSFIFKRYDDGVGVDEAELEVTLKRNSNLTTQVGWAFTPGATGTPSCVWFVGLDDQGNTNTFQMSPRSETGLLGALLYKGSSITKQAAVITGVASDVLETNNYTAKYWSDSQQTEVGSEFTIQNLRLYDVDNNSIITDSSMGTLLAVGQIVDVWTVNINGTDVYFCRENPPIDTNALWATLGAVQFGDELEQRSEKDPAVPNPTDPTVNPTETVGDPIVVNDAPTIDMHEWGVTGLDDPFLLYISPTSQIPATGSVNYTTNIVTVQETDIERRYLEVVDDDVSADNIQRPVHIWHRASLRDAYVEVHLSRPVAPSSGLIYPPIDLLLRAPINVVDSKYGVVTETAGMSGGPLSGFNYAKVAGLDFHDFPPSGAIKVLHRNGSFTLGQTMTYFTKMMDASGAIYLVTEDAPPNAGSVVELLHQDYTTPAARLQFAFNTTNADLEMQPLVGTLSMATEYVNDDPSEPNDNFIKDFSDYTAGQIYTQNGEVEDSTTTVDTNTTGFVVYNGGISLGSDATEVSNVLKVIVRDQRVYMFWNDLLLTPSGTTATSYFPITDVVNHGKFGLRLWPGARVRRFIVRSKIENFSEITLGQS